MSAVVRLVQGMSGGGHRQCRKPDAREGLRELIDEYGLSALRAGCG